MQFKKNNFTRRDFLKMTVAGSAVFGVVGSVLGARKDKSDIKDMLVYVGTYTSGKSKGIYVCKFNLETGALTVHKTIENVVEPSFLTIENNKKYLYAVNEVVEYEGKNSGAVSAFAIDQKTGELDLLNNQSSLGGAPCYVTTTNNSKFVLVANYMGGNVSVYPIESDGKLGASTDLAQHKGSGPNKDRQESAHAHSITLDRNNRFAFAADLGIDRLMIYRFDDQTGKLKPNEAQPFFETKPGAGPRHFSFHSNGKFAFLLNELNMSITSLAYDEIRGTLKKIQTVPTLPADFNGANTCADIHVSPNGKFLYASNRGHDSIVSYRIDGKSGKLKLIEHTSTGGKRPRNFAIDPTGKFLLAANQDSDSIVVFKIEKSGKLTKTAHTAAVPNPVCLKLVSGIGM